MDITPISLLGSTRSRLNEGSQYHSGRIQVSVENAFAGQSNSSGYTTDKPRAMEIIPNITDGKMQSMSFGQAGSPQELWPTPDDSLLTNIRFRSEARELIMDEMDRNPRTMGSINTLVDSSIYAYLYIPYTSYSYYVYQYYYLGRYRFQCHIRDGQVIQ